MEDLIWISDKQILERIGKRVKTHRLQRRATRTSTALAAGIANSTLEKIENGDNYNILSLIQLLRILGQLDDLSLLTKEQDISPSEYEKILQGRKQRKRGSIPFI